GVGCGDDRGEESNAHSPTVDVARHDPAKNRRGDVVEKGSQDEDDPQQRQAAAPIIGEQTRQMIRHVALLEMIGEKLKTDQQQKQIGDDHPFGLKMTNERACPGARGERAEERLIGYNREQPEEADLQRALVEQRHAHQHQPKQYELDRDRHERSAKGLMSARPADPAPGQRRETYFASLSRTVCDWPVLPAFKDSGVTITTLPGRNAAATARRNSAGPSNRPTSSFAPSI